jgi:hypothetical protein
MPKKYFLLGTPNPDFAPDTWGWRDGKLLKNPPSDHPLHLWAGQLRIEEQEFRVAICGKHEMRFVQSLTIDGIVYDVYSCRTCKVEEERFKGNVCNALIAKFRQLGVTPRF